MEIVYSNHALERMEEREIAGRMVERLLLRPERVVEGRSASSVTVTVPLIPRITTRLPDPGTPTPEREPTPAIQCRKRVIQRARWWSMVGSYVMKVSANGQVSIPAEARARWKADRMLVVDLGDRVVMRPLPPDPVAALEGKYAGRGPGTDQARQEARAEDGDREL